VILLVLAAAAVYVLFTWAFPALEPYLPFNDQTVQTGTTG
jgi:hypothetical protein